MVYGLRILLHSRLTFNKAKFIPMEKLKKKIVPALFVAILIPFSSFSQYIPLLKNNASWHVYHWLENGINKTQQLTEDTVINSQVYKILVSDLSGEGPCILREDTTTKKVYQYLNDVEFLLYDFSLTAGEIFVYDNPQSPSWTPHLRLDSISGTIDSEFFKPPADWTSQRHKNRQNSDIQELPLTGNARVFVFYDINTDPFQIIQTFGYLK